MFTFIFCIAIVTHIPHGAELRGFKMETNYLVFRALGFDKDVSVELACGNYNVLAAIAAAKGEV